MRSRLALLIAAATVFAAACSGSDDAGDSLPEITLFTTTTTAPSTTAAPVEPEVTSTTTSTTSTTVVATTPPPATTTAPTTTAPDPATLFELGPEGLGSAAFGADPEGIIGFISSFIGPPTGDTGYVDPFEFGVCSGTQARRVFWGSLMLEFGDVSNVAEGRLHFYAYEYGTIDPAGLAPGTPENLATAEGITYGSTVAEVTDAYPATTFFDADDFTPPSFAVNDNFRGFLTGLSGVDTVTVLTGGLPCQS